MIASLIQSLTAPLPGTASFLIEVAWKSALLVAAVAILHGIAGRKRVLLRSALWHICLVGLLLLPIAVAVLPRMSVALPLVEWESTAGVAIGSVSESPAMIADLDSPPAPIGEPRLIDDTADLASSGAGTPRTATIGKASAVDSGILVPAVVLATYLLVVLGLLVRLGVSLVAVARLRRSGAPVSNPAWLNALDERRAQFELPCAVQLCQAAAVTVPVVIGWRHPVILLPTGLAPTTDKQAIDAVLLHELTHVRRGDFAWNLLLRIVQALYWPHPGVWLAGRFVRQVREEICDAVCVHWLGDIRSYCAILVDVASGIGRRPEMALGMAMTRSSKLSRRLERLERSAGSARGLLGRPARGTLAVVFVAAACLIGTLQLHGRAATADDPGATSKPRRDQPVETKSLKSDAPKTPAETPDDAAADQPRIETTRPEDPEEPDAKSKPLRVHTVKVQRGKLAKTISVPASLTAFEPVSIHARSAGIVSKVAVDEGDRVKKGDVLLVLEIPDLEAELAKCEAMLAQADVMAEQAEASLEAATAAVAAAEATITEVAADSQRSAAALTLAKKQYERMQKLFEQKAVEAGILDEHKEKLEAAEADRAATAARVQTAKANLTQTKAKARLGEAELKAAKFRVSVAKADLKRSQAQESSRAIRAPIDGVILSRRVHADLFIKPDDGLALLSLAPTDRMTAIVALPENEAHLVKRGAAAVLSAKVENTTKSFPGEVSRVAYGVDPTSHTVAAQITVANPRDLLKPGIFARAKITIGEIPDTLSVPASAVTTFALGNASMTGCFRVVNGRTAMTTPTLGHKNGERIEILKGLSDGDEVILDASDGERLYDDQPVEVIPPLEK